MAQSVITHAFETWNVQRVLDGVAARPDKVVFARIPGQDESVPVDRTKGYPLPIRFSIPPPLPRRVF